MAPVLPPRPSLDSLRKQARQLLRQFRAGDTDAQARVTAAHPRPAAFAALRDAQFVLAREYGCADWAQLLQRVELALLLHQPLAQQAARFVDLACLQYNGGDRAERHRRASQMLQANPALAAHDICTAVTAGDLATARSLLAGQPALARETGGPRDWPPLLYLCYSRVPAPAPRAPLELARLLLDHGADPNSYTVLWDNRFTALTGAMGEGEGGPDNQPPHACAAELARLLLDAGAEPNEQQGLYNTHFSADDRWLQLLIEHGLDAHHQLDAPPGQRAQSTFDYQLCAAVSRGYAARVELLLAHGADPNAHNGYNGRAAHTTARLQGHPTIAARLLESGATPEVLGPADELRLCFVDSDLEQMRALVSAHPALREDARLLQDGAAADPAVLACLLALEFDVNARTEDGRTALHNVASAGALEKVKLLLARGARCDILDKVHHGSAAAFAHHCGHPAVRDYLLRHGDDVFELAAATHHERLGVLLDADPRLSQARNRDGNTALHLAGLWQDAEPGDSAIAATVELLLVHGADIDALNAAGQTPLDACLAREAEAPAALLLARGARRGAPP